MAKHALRGHWPQALVVLLALTASYSVLMCCRELIGCVMDVRPDGLSLSDLLNAPQVRDLDFFLADAAFWLLELAALSPLAVGASRWFFLITSGRDAELGEAFYYYSSAGRYFKALGVSALVAVRLLLWGFLLYLPSVACLALANPAVRARFGLAPGGAEAALSVCAVPLALLATVGMIFLLVRYFAVSYVLVLDETLSVRQIVRRAVRVSAGNRARFFVLICSFAGWGALCLTVLPILYVWPYFLASRTVFARFALLEYGRRRKRALFPEPSEKSSDPEAGEPAEPA